MSEGKRYEITDVHVHLQDARLGATWEEVERYVRLANEAGVTRFVCSGTSPADWNRVRELARRIDGVIPTFGTHPWWARKISGETWVPVLAELLASVVAKDGTSKAFLGEVGLDFAVEDCDEVEKREQERVLRAQLDLADALGIPVVLHSVRANDVVLNLLSKYAHIPSLLLHNWTATQREIERAVELGAFFSFSSRGARPNASRAKETIVNAPFDKILLESDAPQLIPPTSSSISKRRFPPIYLQRRDSDGLLLESPASIVETGREISALRGVSQDEFFEQLQRNEERFFQSAPRRK